MNLCETAAAMAAQGLSPNEIAARLGVPKRTVHDRLRYAAKGQKSIRVPATALPVLEAHAEARRMPVASLVSALLVAVAQDDLVPAILDDGLTSPEPQHD